MRESKRDVVKRLHPLAWVWEPLEMDPSFVLRAMFGAKSPPFAIRAESERLHPRSPNANQVNRRACGQWITAIKAGSGAPLPTVPASRSNWSILR